METLTNDALTNFVGLFRQSCCVQLERWEARLAVYVGENGEVRMEQRHP
jgi:hypothetical protein